MQLSNEQIKEFKNILEKDKGKKVSWEETSDAGHRLMRRLLRCL